jgi:hypothetical protein
MPRVGYEPTISVFERATTFQTSDCSAIVIGYCDYYTYSKSKNETALGDQTAAIITWFCEVSKARKEKDVRRHNNNTWDSMPVTCQ